VEPNSALVGPSLAHVCLIILEKESIKVQPSLRLRCLGSIGYGDAARAPESDAVA
jgi:hypothetical protein